MNISLFKKFEVYKKLYESDTNGREINVYRFQNCSITGINLHYPNILLCNNENLILPVLERTMSLKMGTIYEKMNMTYEYEKKDILSHCHTPVFFFIYNTDNYFHFVYDTLPYLISYFEIKKDIPELKLLMNYPNDQKHSFYPFVLEFLEIVGISQDDILLVNSHTCHKELYVSTSYTHDFDSNVNPRKEIYGFYQRIVELVKKDLFYETPRKIYVSRRTWLHNDFSNIGTNYTTRRRLINEDELVEKLVADGYQEVFTETLTTIDKILYFSNATHVVGAIGGGIANVLFSPTSTKLQAIVSPTFLEVNSRFKYCLEGVDVYYNYNTDHIEDGEYKKYMRVKTKDGKIVGEIEEIRDNRLFVSYTDGSNTGWNAQNKFKQIELDRGDVEKLDNGLNSPWRLELSSIL
jgi:hypothetical protein